MARLSPATKAREGAPLELWFDKTKLHLFDAATGQALGR